MAAKESPGATTSEAITEKVVKAPALSGEVVFYHNAYVPTIEHNMPKEDWDRLAKDNQLGNAVFIRSEGGK